MDIACVFGQVYNFFCNLWEKGVDKSWAMSYSIGG